MARGSWVGNQVAIGAIYAGIARGAYDYALDRVMNQKFADTGAPIASSPMHQVMIGHAEKELQQHTMLHLLEEKLGIPLGTIRHSVESVKADVEVASLLGVSVFEPVLYMETAVYSAEGRAVEAVDTYFRSDRYRYTVELIRSQQLRKDRGKRPR